MEITQVILASAVLVLTAILTLVGFEVFLIFRELRRSVKNLNKILDHASFVTESVSKQITGVAELLSAARTTVDLIKAFFTKGRLKEERGGGILPEEEPKKEISSEGKESFSSPIRRFFTRAGRRLS